MIRTVLTSLLIAFIYVGLYIPHTFAGGLISMPNCGTTENSNTTHTTNSLPCTPTTTTNTFYADGLIFHQLENGAIPEVVRIKVNEYPVISHTPTGKYQPKGFSHIYHNNKLYLYICYILTDLAYTIEIMHCQLKGDTLCIYAKPVLRYGGRGQGKALHSCAKLISVNDSLEQIQRIQLMTYKSIGHYQVIV